MKWTSLENLVEFHRGQSLRLSPLLWLGAGIILFFLLIALIGPWILPNDPLLVRMSDRLLPPSAEFPLGTDHLGRCILSRIIDGTRTTMSTSFLVLTTVILIGVPIGMLSGFWGGKLDTLLMRTVDGIGAVPEFLLAVAVAGFLGPGLLHVMLAVACVKWITYARLVRSIVLLEKEKDYVKAAVVAGSGMWIILYRHLARQVASPLAVMAALDVGRFILLISMLSFLGLGVQAPAPEWGAMLNEGRSYFQAAPQLMIYPGLCILMVVFSSNLISDDIRDHLDIRNR
ncbi:nickel ABC transporter permease subunit NikC [Paenibacillus amylolyticus]|uniref:Nickel ABC transporter permease subunit NikC n=1 Tax=Paenibacillus amylolyticus TaxID=1451 RepID=A0A1R1C0C1_PAEAM|nr:nickel transporter permease [Paenibacillus amylolyticus]OMF15514.1 nickel ABC transporter permease subunit NikC [Paenibacillus amylolyticus]